MSEILDWLRQKNNGLTKDTFLCELGLKKNSNLLKKYWIVYFY